MSRHPLALALALATLGGPVLANGLAGPEPLPRVPALPGAEVDRVPRDALMSIEPLDSYGEPDWVRALVDNGQLPPVADRLPDAPIVLQTGAAPDGDDRYGGVFRHVSGARPQGWNWSAGQHQGYFGINMTHQECLVNTAGLFLIDGSDQEPLPNLATSWEWSEDGHQLTMHLIEGAKWSDGDPFDAEDVTFFWDHNVMDPRVAAKMGPNSLGDGTTLEKVDDHTVRFTFAAPFPVAQLYNLAYPNFCPGPSHLLKEHHPTFNDQASYDDYQTAFPPERIPWVTMGPWSTVSYKPDQMLVARRNPYYFKVDQDGNQLPYLDEVRWQLSSKQDRDIQTIAGNADYTNFSDPSSYSEAISVSQKDGAPFSLTWGSRAFDWRVDMNLSTTCGADTDEDMARRELFRSFDFRRAVSQAVDRQALGQALVRGPFTAPTPGGIHPESTQIDGEASVYYPYAPETSKTLLARLGFEDTDGNGILNWTDGPLAGQDLALNLHFTTYRTTDATLADGVVSMLREVGVRLVPRPLSDYVAVVRDTCDWDLAVERGTREYEVPITNLSALAPLNTSGPEWHRGTPERPQDLLPFEEEIVAIARQVQTERDGAKRVELLTELQRLFTGNIYNVGLITATSAIAISDRFENVIPGTPGLSYQFGELNIMRERLWISADRRGDVEELEPATLGTQLSQ